MRYGGRSIWVFQSLYVAAADMPPGRLVLELCNQERRAPVALAAGGPDIRGHRDDCHGRRGTDLIMPGSHGRTGL
jgi:hypothetical protein